MIDPSQSLHDPSDARGRQKGASVAAVHPVQEYVTFLQLKGRSRHTIRLYRGTLKDLAEWLKPDRDLLGATAADLAAWRAGLAVSDASVAAYVSAVRGFYGWAVRSGRLTSDPTAMIPTPSVPRRLPRPIADDDLELAIDTATDRIRPWLVLAGYAGLRAVEVARLQREDIYDSVAEPYFIIHGKRNKERIVPMSSYVWTEIRVALPRRGWVYPRRDGRPGHISAGSVSQLCNAHLSACGLQETMHQLRHRFGTATYAATRDLRVVQELLGHGSPATTAIYTAHSNPDAVRAVNAIVPDRRLRPVRDQ